MSTPPPLCDCDSCVEVRALRQERPGFKVTWVEQVHNLGVAQGRLNAVVLASPPISWLRRWTERHPRQAVAVASLLCLVLVAIFVFVEPVQR